MLTTIRFYTPTDIPQELIDLGSVPGAQDGRGIDLDVEGGVLISGRAGSGKTLNLNGICESAASGGYTVIRLHPEDAADGYRAAVRVAANGRVLIVIDEAERLSRSREFEKKIEIITRGIHSIRWECEDRVALVIAAESVGSVDKRLLSLLSTHIDQDTRALDGMPTILNGDRQVFRDGRWVRPPSAVWRNAGYGA